MKTKIFLITCIVLTGYSAFSQVKIGTNPTNINSASLLELESNSQGFVLPRLPIGSVTSSAPLSPSLLTSTIVYNTNSSVTGGTGIGIYIWDGSKWNPISTSISSTAWLLNGNKASGTSYFLGTIDNSSLRFRTNNTQQMIIDSLGNVGIANASPTQKLDVTGNVKFSGALMPNNNAGVAGQFLISSGTGIAPVWFDASGYTWLLDGNPVTSIRKFGTTTNFDLPFITNNTERMRLTAGGFLGIGTTNPSNVLSVSGTNPLYLSGVQATTTFSTDSILTINAGVVKKTAYSSLSGATTNALTLSTNTLTSTVNGVAATSNAVSGVNNTSNANTLSTTVNGVTSATVPIINTNTNALTQAGGLVTSVNGVAATTPISSGTVSNVIGYDASGTPVYQSLNNVNFSTAWNTTGNSGTTAGTNFIGTTDNVDFVTKTNGIERMRVLANGRVGIGITNPAYPLAVKDTMEIRRVGSLSSLLFTNTSGTGDFRIGGDGGDIFWQGGGGRALQMGSYWTTIIGGDRQTGTYPAFINAYTGTSVLVQGQRDVSVPLGVQANSSTQSANLTEWRNSSATALSVINKNGYMGIGITSPPNALSVLAASNPLYLSGVQATTTFNTDSILTINAGIVKKAPFSSLNSTSWSTTGNTGTSYPLNFLGTTDNNSLHIRTNNIERMVIDSVGSVGIGSSAFTPGDREKLLVDYGTTTSNNLVTLRGGINDYLQLNIQNTSSGSNASTDYVATANDGTDSTYYVDFGINSSTYAPSIDNFGGPHDGYMYSSSRNLVIGTAATNSDVIFLLGGGRTKINAALRLQASTGNVVVGTGDGSTTPIGNVIRGVSGTGTNIAGGNLGVQGGAGTGSAAGGNLNLAGGNSVSGSGGNITLSTGSTERMRVSALGNVGIGTTNPGYPLSVLSAANPLYLSGVQSTSTFSTDSILTINAGVVKKAASSALIANWNLTGNAGTTASSNRIGYAANNNFLGTTDATNFTIADNNINRAIFDQAGNLYGGGTGTNISSAANASFAWGDSNIVYGSDALVAGYYNIDSSKYSFVFGNNNVLGAGGARTNRGTLVGGGQNVVTGGQSYNSIITGSQNILSGDNFESLVLGYNNMVTNSQKVIVSGQASSVSGSSFGMVSGGFNSMTNVSFGTILGGGNSIGSGAGYGVTIGQNNTIPANQSNAMALGAGVTTTASGQFAANFSGGYNLFTTTGATTSTTPDLSITSAGNVGIGISNPPNVLSVLAASNPLYLSGVQATSTFSSDSVLTINAGVVKKTPYASLLSIGIGVGTGNTWSLTGNSITSGQFLGTTNAQALILKANNVQIGSFDGNVSSLALGVGAVNNSSDHNVAIGYNANTNNQYTLAIGYNASATGVRSVAIGNGSSATVASGSEAVAIGYNATANNTQTVAIGYQSQATGQYAVGLGYNPTASGLQSLAIGYQAQATQQYASAFGYQAQATGLASTAIGYLAQTSQSNTILLGNVNQTNLYVGIGTATPTAKLHIVGGNGNNPLQLVGLPAGTVGTDNMLTINSSGVVGSVSAATFASSYWTLSGNAASSGNFLGTTNNIPLQFKFNSTLAGYLDANNTALGTSSAATAGSQNTSIGYSSTASNSSTAIGASSVAASAGNTAVGNTATASNSSQETAIGATSVANAQYNTAVGYNAQAINNSQATAVGTTALANANQATALGYGAQAISNGQTTALGANSLANAQYNTAVGYNAQAISNSQATAVGYNSKANAQFSVAIGYNAQAINNQQTTAIGSATQATGALSNAIGYNAQATNTQTTADGAATTATAANASAFGYSADATGTQSNAIGSNAQATGNNTTAEGYNAQATVTQATAIGSGSLANQQNTTALGYNAKAQGANSSAIGYNAQTSQSNAMVLGDATNTSLSVGIGTSTPNTSARLDVAGSFKLGSVGTVLSNLIKGTATVNIGAIGIGGTGSTTFSVPNAIVGAIVSVSPKATLPYSVVIGYAYVSAANTVTITFGVGGTATSGFTTTLDVSVLQ